MQNSSCPLLVVDELIGGICLKLRAYEPGQNNRSIHNIWAKYCHFSWLSLVVGSMLSLVFQSDRRARKGPKLRHCSPATLPGYHAGPTPVRERASVRSTTAKPNATSSPARQSQSEKN